MLKLQSALKYWNKSVRNNCLLYFRDEKILTPVSIITYSFIKLVLESVPILAKVWVIRFFRSSFRTRILMTSRVRYLCNILQTETPNAFCLYSYVDCKPADCIPNCQFSSSFFAILERIHIWIFNRMFRSHTWNITLQLHSDIS